MRSFKTNFDMLNKNEKDENGALVIQKLKSLSIDVVETANLWI